MRRLAVRALAVAIGVGALVVTSGAAASAHPLGNFTVNRYSGLVVAADAVTIEHVLDLAEIPTAQRTPAIDTNSDGRLGTGELAAWAAKQCAATVPTLRLTVAGERVPLTVTRAAASTTPGQAEPADPAPRLRAAGRGVGERHDRDGVRRHGVHRPGGLA